MFLSSYSYYTMLQPVSLGCGHSGCKSCIEMQFEMEASGVAPKCAVCRTTLTETPGSLGINYVLHQFTRDLPVKCMSSGCTWSGVYSDAGSHCSVCGKLELKCENDGCLYMSTREEMSQHAAACLKKEIPCPDCKKSVMWELMERHRSSLCFHAMIHKV